ncbi:helix-turn-helix transcriptional regulator [Ancylobacter koreensis]|uniref:helix-turn-helix transcriptional regulator n=1 Tax=Ancylobacter koreensis TaxID=266121 RepID=UPI003CCFE9C7
MSSSDDEYVNVKGASAICGLSVSSLNKYRVHGGGPKFCRAGRLVRYRVSDVRAWLESSRVSSTSEYRKAG